LLAIDFFGFIWYINKYDIITEWSSKFEDENLTWYRNIRIYYLYYFGRSFVFETII
jgi:hypothetical protein